MRVEYVSYFITICFTAHILKKTQLTGLKLTAMHIHIVCGQKGVFCFLFFLQCHCMPTVKVQNNDWTQCP